MNNSCDCSSYLAHSQCFKDVNFFQINPEFIAVLSKVVALRYERS